MSWGFTSHVADLRGMELHHLLEGDPGGHFLPEERPDLIIAQILGVTEPTEGAAT